MNFTEYPYVNFSEMNLDWFLTEFKKMVEEFNELKIEFTTIKDLVEAFINRFRDVMTEVTIAELRKMVDDGTMSLLLEPIVEGYVDEIANSTVRGGDFDAERVFRDFEFLDTDPWGGSVKVCNRMQGGAIDSEGNYYIVYWDNRRKTERHNTLVKYNANGVKIQSVTFTGGWCNGLAVTDDKIYVVYRGYDTIINGVETPVFTNEVGIFNKSTLSLESVVSTPNHYKSFYYYDGNIYGMSQDGGNDLKIYRLDPSLNRAEMICNADSLSYNADGTVNNIQNFALNDKFIYLISSAQSAGIYTYYRNNGVFKYNKAKDKFMNTYMYGELQWISVKENDLYFGGTVSIWNKAVLHNFWKTNLINGIYSTGNYRSQYITAPTFYCDSNANSTNPNGTTANPFKYAEEVGACVGDFFECTITGIHRFLYLGGISHCKVSGNCSFEYGAYIRRCSEAEIISTNMVFNGTLVYGSCISLDECGTITIRCSSITGGSTYGIYCDAVGKANIIADSITNSLVYNRYSNVSCNKPISFTNTSFSSSYNHAPVAIYDNGYNIVDGSSGSLMKRRGTMCYAILGDDITYFNGTGTNNNVSFVRTYENSVKIYSYSIAIGSNAISINNSKIVTIYNSGNIEVETSNVTPPSELGIVA